MVVLQSQFLLLKLEICIFVTAVNPTKNHEQESYMINSPTCFVPFFKMFLTEVFNGSRTKLKQRIIENKKNLKNTQCLFVILDVKLRESRILDLNRCTNWV